MFVAAALVVLLAAVPLAANALAYSASRGQRGDAGTEPLGAAGAARAFLREWLATLALIGATPFRLRARSRDAAPRRVAVFVPELHCSSAAFWYLRRRLQAAGWVAVAGIEGADCTGAAAATTAPAALDARIAALPPGTDIVLIGHGVGGLLARNYAAARPQLRVRHVISLGTPHQGSRALPYALLGAAVPAPVANRHQVDVIAICSDFDAWLVPIDDAYCPRAFNIAVRGIGHCAMLLSRRVADLIAENLAAPPPQGCVEGGSDETA
jgi:pimeloyl-ACP methyl ester carboxylesterase